MAWKGYAPYKQKTIPTPDVQKNDSVGNIHIAPIEVADVIEGEKQSVTGSRKARKQKPVTWS